MIRKWCYQKEIQTPQTGDWENLRHSGTYTKKTYRKPSEQLFPNRRVTGQLVPKSTRTHFGQLVSMSTRIHVPSLVNSYPVCLTRAQFGKLVSFYYAEELRFWWIFFFCFGMYF